MGTALTCHYSQTPRILQGKTVRRQVVEVSTPIKQDGGGLATLYLKGPNGGDDVC